VTPRSGPAVLPPRVLTTYVGVLIVADLAFSTSITPLLPHYVHVAGLSKAGAGILVAAFPVGSIAGALPGGVVAGRFGPRAAVLAGLAVQGAAGLAFGWSSAIVLLVAARLLQGAAGSCIWSGGMAWLAAATSQDVRGEVVGKAMGFAAAGALAGPAVGAAASWVGPGPAFSAAAGVSGALVIGAFRLPCPGGTDVRDLLPRLWVLRDRAVATGLGLTLLAGMALGVLEVLAPLRLSELGASALVIAGVFIAGGAGEAALSPLTGRLSDRRGEAAPARLLLAAGAGVSLAFPLVGRAGWLAVLLAVGMPAYGSLCTPASTLVSKAADRLRLHQGMVFGLTSLAWSGGQATASMAAGAGAQATSDLVPGVLLAGLCLAAAAALAPGAPQPGPVSPGHSQGGSR
jgi:MFS family permease